MKTLATSRLSSRGQIVIPEEIRASLGLKPGDRFVVIAEPGVVIFKTIGAPDLGEFDALISKARRQARRAGLRKADVAAAIRRARGRRR